MFMDQEPSHGLPGQCGIYYNAAVDCVRLNPIPGCGFKPYAKHNPAIESIGILAFISTSFSGYEAKKFRGLREIVILIGNSRGDCEMQLVDVEENPVLKCGLSFNEWRSFVTDSPFIYADHKRCARKESPRAGRRIKGDARGWESRVMTVSCLSSELHAWFP
jgi:hypothetical protein